MTTTILETSQPKLQTWKYLAKIVQLYPGWYIALLIGETMFFAVFPLITGLLIRAIFDTLSGEAAVGVNVYTLIALLVANAAAKSVVIFADVWVYFNFRWSAAALLRTNLFTHILKRPGARAVPDSPGEAVSRFRGDVDEIIAAHLGGFLHNDNFLLPGCRRRGRGGGRCRRGRAGSGANRQTEEKP